MPQRSLRRSRRATKKTSEYNVGDVVEINRGDVVLNGRLAQLLTEGSSPNPRWLVKFDGQHHKHEEMYERSFGKLISQAEDDAVLNNPTTSSPPSSQRRTGKPTGNGAVTRKAGSGKNSGTSSEGEGGDDSKAAKSAKQAVTKKSVSFTDGSHAGSDASSTPDQAGTTDKVSAREQRSRRRQAKIDEETVPAALVGEAPTAVAKRRIPPPPNHAKKRQRHSDDGEVVKMKLLTGTLYLYRGQNRRVEFIRRV